MSITIEAGAAAVAESAPLLAAGCLPAVHPFALRQTTAALRRFPACRGDFDVEADSIAAALAVQGWHFGLRITPHPVGVGYEIYGEQPLGPADHDELRWAIDQWLSLSDDVTGFYEAAHTDNPRVSAVVAEQCGLHHVRYLTPAEAVVSVVLAQGAQRSAVQRAKRRLVEAFGGAVTFAGRTFTTFPEFADLLHVGVEGFSGLVGGERRAAALDAALRAVVELSPEWLRTAPYDEAERALREVPGIGPRTCEGILVDGFGRMERLPAADVWQSSTRRLYRRAYSADAIRARYGRYVGYWAYYLQNSVG